VFGGEGGGLSRGKQNDTAENEEVSTTKSRDARWFWFC